MLDARHIPLAGLLAGLLILSGCGGRATQTAQSPETDTRIVARASTGYRLTMAQFMEAIEKSTLKMMGGHASKDELADFRDSMVADTLTGFAADEEVDLTKHWFDNWTYHTRLNNLLLSAYLEHKLQPLVQVDSSEVIEFYEQNRERFRVPELIEVSHLLAAPATLRTGRDSAKYKDLTVEEVRLAARDYAYMMLAKLDSGMSFKEVAFTYSHDVNAQSDSGYGGWLPRNSIRPPFDSVAFALQPGQYSQPFEDSEGWNIVMVHDHKLEGVRPVTDTIVYNSISQSLSGLELNRIARAAVDSLTRDISLTVNEPLLDSNLLTLPDSLWYGIVNGQDTIDVLTMRNSEDSYRMRQGLSSTTPDQKREILRGLARQFTVVQAARRERLDTIPKVRDLATSLRHQTVKLVMMRDWYDQTWTPSDSMIEAYYERNPKEFKTEKPYKVQQIVTQDSLLAVFLRDQARSGVDFIDLAKEYYPGEESIRAELADLGFIGPKDVDPNFYGTAAMLAVGEVSEPVKTKYGWHVIKMLERNESKSLGNARVDISRKLTDEHREAEFEQFQKRLFAKYDVKFPYLPETVFLEPFDYRKK